MSIRKAQDERIEGTPDGLTAVTEISDVPDAPTIGTATATGQTTATVTYTAAATGGTATTFTATSTPGSITGTGSSPITVSGLTAGTAYTFTVRGSNSTGTSPESAASNLTTTSVAIRGVIAGGYTGAVGSGSVGTKLSSIEYITIATLGNFTSFGNLTTTKNGAGGLSSSTRGLFVDVDGGANQGTVDYITIATTGNATSFGSISTDVVGVVGGCSNETRGVIAGGIIPGTETMISGGRMQYFTIASTGNSTTFGNMVLPRYSVVGMGSSTRGLFAMGNYNFSAGAGPSSEIEYITIATTGNATVFGDATLDRDDAGAASNDTRGLIATGYIDGSNLCNVIDYVTIATTGNAIDFGDMSSNRRNQTGLASPTRIVFTVGNVGQGPQYYLPTGSAEYVTIASTGNSSSFGDLVQQRFYTMSASNGHGGV